MARHLLRALGCLALFATAACVAPPEQEAGEIESAAGVANVGTPRRQRVVLVQAESDSPQAAFFRGMPNATVISSYEAGIYWAREGATPTVQENLDALIDKYVARIEADLTAKESADPGYEESIVLALAGHSTGFSFFGHSRTAAGNVNRAQITPERVKALAAKFPRFAKNVRGMFLLGCNAGHKDKMELWRRSFPNVAAVAGFNSRAPDGESGGNMLVKFSLSEWQKLGLLNRGATLPTDDAALFRGIASCRASKCLGVMTQVSYGSTVDFVVQGSPAWEIVVGGAAHWDAVFPPDGPSTLLAKISLLEDEYRRYLTASDEAHADPPASTSTGLVRQYNNLSQQYLAAAGAAATPADVARVSQSIRLTLYRDLKHAWLEENGDLVTSLGLDPEVLAAATRHDVIRAVRELPADKRSSAGGRRLAAALVDLDPAELPDTML